MRFFETIELAIKNLLGSKVRSLLTMLGIIIGVGAVIIITSLGNGMENFMVDSFSSMGTNVLNVTVMGKGSTRTLDFDELYEHINENQDLYNHISPTVNVPGSVKVGTETLEQTSMTGVSEDYNELKSLVLSQGRYVQYVDVTNYSKVIVIGSYIADNFFDDDVIGQTMKINGQVFTIVGVLDEVADSEKGDSDDIIHLPYSSALKLAGSSVISSYAVEVRSVETVDASKEDLRYFLYDIFKDEDAYMIFSMSELLDTMTSMINIMVVILAAIAAISLVVGGIGIMNITLVSVTERTREIGIRKSLGAKRHNIMQQFVIEAATTSAIGGIIGIGFGYLMSSLGTLVISQMLDEDISLLPTLSSVMIAFGVSVTIGIVFGYLPARNAARLNPIDALRYD
jgi:putative ABC transport system permease protein